MSSNQQLDISAADKKLIVQNFIRDATTDFKIISTEASKFGEQRAGYLGDHFELKFAVLVTNEDVTDGVLDIALFAKAMPKAIPSLARYLEQTEAFSKEANLYRELIPRLQKLGRFAPEVLFSAANGELIVFRNLKLEGFRPLQNNDGLFDLVHLEQALRVLARMHAACWALERQTGKLVTEMHPGLLDENSWVLKEDFPRVNELENNIATLLALVKHYEKDDKRRNDLVEKIPSCVRQIYELVKTSGVYRNVFSHADLWNNNMMFRYSEHGSPIDCLLVDFQLSRYVPPAYDFNMLLSLTMTSGYRRKHLSFLQGYYYQSLRMELTRHGIAIEDILTQEDFQESCHMYRKAGAIDGFFINHITLLPKDVLDEVFSSAEKYESFTSESKTTECLKAYDESLCYKTRMIDIIENIVDIFGL
ncbi:uncharacterized protein LOC134218067 [Armigeres subalbatus]|uniref:uncharacterized protein LOC134218067 n=1 Tax=Armigeres subalbatus TaxID=124917 RepID=UPI002ED431DE